MKDHLDRLLALAFDEDLGASGDITSLALIPESMEGRAELVAKEPMTIAGIAAFSRAFHFIDTTLVIEPMVREGAQVQSRDVIALLRGKLRSLLTGERTALNLIQRTSGIATLAHRAQACVKGTGLRILDTRKTSPGMRALSKEAVRIGGAYNHRFGLFDGILIKDNHIAAVGGSVREAIRRAKAHAPYLLKIEVEVASLDQLDEALSEGADLILLDNMSDEQLRKAVALVSGRVPLEASGNVTLERLPILAQVGVNFVSMGALTHSARAVDLSLEVT